MDFFAYGGEKTKVKRITAIQREKHSAVLFGGNAWQFVCSENTETKPKRKQK